MFSRRVWSSAAVVTGLLFTWLCLGPASWAAAQEKAQEKPQEKAAKKDEKAPQADRVEPKEPSAEPKQAPAEAEEPSRAQSILRKAEERYRRQGEERGAGRRPLRDPLRGMAPLPVPPDGYGYSYYPYYPYYPWYGLPPTGWVKDYPPSITHVPRIGLQHTYPYAYQMGLRVPEDSDPLHVEPNLGPFVGVVGAAKAELAEAARAAREEPAAEPDGAIALIHEGKYKEAGRVLADRFQSTEDPRDALLLCEVFFALGKPSHAEMLLRHALDSDRLAAALPADVSRHFPSPDDLEKRLQDLDSAGEHRLLLGYLKLHSRNPDAGLDILHSLVKESPKDKGAARLYRHYLGKAFKE